MNRKQTTTASEPIATLSNTICWRTQHRTAPHKQKFTKIRTRCEREAGDPTIDLAADHMAIHAFAKTRSLHQTSSHRTKPVRKTNGAAKISQITEDRFRQYQGA